LNSYFTFIIPFSNFFISLFPQFYIPSNDISRYSQWIDPWVFKSVNVCPWLGGGGGRPLGHWTWRGGSGEEGAAGVETAGQAACLLHLLQNEVRHKIFHHKIFTDHTVDAVAKCRLLVHRMSQNTWNTDKSATPVVQHE
jgi:hypothetical protein